MIRYALLASCFIASGALAQEIPATPFHANASAKADDAGAMATATASSNMKPTRLQPQAPVPAGMPPPVPTMSPDKPLSRKEAVGVTTAKRWINKFQKPRLDADGVVHFTSGRGQVFVVTAVDHITDVALMPGETIFLPLHVGDAESWRFHPAQSRVGGRNVSHILVKPVDAGLSTNMVIETNKRTISVSFTSRQHDYMPLVALDQEEENDANFVTAGFGPGPKGLHQTNETASSVCDTAPIVTQPDQFRIKGDDAAWRPTQVYQVSTEVGIKTCIDMPINIGSVALPALLGLKDDGTWFTSPTLYVVNSRFVNRRFIVDEQLDRMAFVDGVGRQQDKVTVIRKGR